MVREYRTETRKDGKADGTRDRPSRGGNRLPSGTDGQVDPSGHSVLVAHEVDRSGERRGRGEQADRAGLPRGVTDRATQLDRGVRAADEIAGADAIAPSRVVDV
jgi:hypothetical protein